MLSLLLRADTQSLHTPTFRVSFWPWIMLI